jgi:tetratricopeptide (TPR) repeat protein
MLVACGGGDDKPIANAEQGADPAPSTSDIAAFTEERDRLLAKDARVEVEKICRSWIERQNPIARAEGHKCWANVLVHRAADSGEAVMVSSPGQRLAVGALVPEPRFVAAEIAPALDELDRAAAAHPADLSIHQGRLFLALGSGDFGRAVKSLTASLQAHPQAPPETWLVYMASFPRAKAHHAAVFARALVDKYPDSAPVRVALGAWLDLTGNEREAKQHLEHALQLDASNPMAHWRLGEVLEQRGANESAREHYKASVALDGELAEERRSEYARRGLGGS